MSAALYGKSSEMINQSVQRIAEIMTGNDPYRKIYLYGGKYGAAWYSQDEIAEMIEDIVIYGRPRNLSKNA